VIFNGNGYSPEWHEEAERRGLPNFKNAVDAIGHFVTDRNVAVFERFGVLTKKEVEARTTVMFEAYVKAVAIEAQSALGIAGTMLLPAAQRYQCIVGEALERVRSAPAKIDARPQEAAFAELTRRIGALIDAHEKLSAAFEKAERHGGSAREHATTYRDTVVPATQKVREAADALEVVVDDALWPLPKYREMLFVH
jgi:glutamine synthetase